MRTQTPMGSSRSPRAAILLASLGLVRFLPLAALIDPPVEDHLDVRLTCELPLQILVEVLRGPGNDEQVALFSHRSLHVGSWVPAQGAEARWAVTATY